MNATVENKENPVEFQGRRGGGGGKSAPASGEIFFQALSPESNSLPWHMETSHFFQIRVSLVVINSGRDIRRLVLVFAPV